MNKKIIDRIKKENYVTSYPTDTSGYLTPDGEWIHLISKQDEDRGGQYREDHRAICHFLNKLADDYSGAKAMMRIMKKYGFIRYSPESHGFEFAKWPTKAQCQEIISYYEDLPYGENIIIEKMKDYSSTPISLTEFMKYALKKGVYFKSNKVYNYFDLNFYQN